ncbi:MAG: SHOCT domain-containing protein [Fimbriimonadales bacterium]
MIELRAEATRRRARVFDLLVGGSTALLFGALFVRVISNQSVSAPASQSSESSGFLLLLFVMCSAGVATCIGTMNGFKFHGIAGVISASLWTLGLIGGLASPRWTPAVGMLLLGLPSFTFGTALYALRRRKQVEWDVTSVRESEQAEVSLTHAAADEVRAVEPASIRPVPVSQAAEMAPLPGGDPATKIPDTAEVAEIERPDRRLSTLERLAELRASGALTDAEFELLKRDALDK